MNKEIKKLWIEALRSGKYKQGSGALHQRKDNEERFCCLGVLCDVLKKEQIMNFSITEVEKGDGYDYSIFLYDGESDFPNTSLLLLDKNYDSNRRLQTYLGDLNDTGHSFDEISDYIEKNL